MDFNTAVKVSEIMGRMARFDRKLKRLDEQDATNSRIIDGWMAHDDDQPTGESAQKIREIFRNETLAKRDECLRELRKLGVDLSQTESLATANLT